VFDTTIVLLSVGVIITEELRGPAIVVRPDARRRYDSHPTPSLTRGISWLVLAYDYDVDAET
jgi:hypothetical protein